MAEQKSFVEEVVNLTTGDLNKLYKMAVSQIKEGRANGKDVSELEEKLGVIMDETMRRLNLKNKAPTMQVRYIPPYDPSNKQSDDFER